MYGCTENSLLGLAIVGSTNKRELGVFGRNNLLRTRSGFSEASESPHDDVTKARPITGGAEVLRMPRGTAVHFCQNKVLCNSLCQILT